VNFYISLENAKNRYISAAVQPTSTKYGMMIQNVSSAPSVKNFILKVQDGGRPIYCTIMRYRNLMSIFKMAAVCHLLEFGN